MWRIYRLLSWILIFKAAKRGPKSLVKQRIRAKSMGWFARQLKKIFPVK